MHVSDVADHFEQSLVTTLAVNDIILNADTSLALREGFWPRDSSIVDRE